MMNRSNSIQRIDKDLIKQLENETRYWRDVLRRTIDVITFICERGLAFRGSDQDIGSNHNGNYLGILELLSKYDPFLSTHIEKYSYKGLYNT